MAGYSVAKYAHSTKSYSSRMIRHTLDITLASRRHNTDNKKTVKHVCLLSLLLLPQSQLLLDSNDFLEVDRNRSLSFDAAKIIECSLLVTELSVKRFKYTGGADNK